MTEIVRGNKRIASAFALFMTAFQHRFVYVKSSNAIGRSSITKGEIWWLYLIPDHYKEVLCAELIDNIAKYSDFSDARLQETFDANHMKDQWEFVLQNKDSRFVVEDEDGYRNGAKITDFEKPQIKYGEKTFPIENQIR